ncbi:dTDP-glucose 4,6-dehydratase [Planctomycetota bacterium]|jgi:dTDP-glucose 4,6-dehydratase|nr:dTDP-glucose 4,6-dehydratase [Planctomycetota bacterium]MSR37282.1 dTDP-glucose 4,6-dehydratase [Planctomycetota bacterium]GDY01196.1 dTDP-glucose 4,6-dehydratase [Planctomycetota bacterium]
MSKLLVTGGAGFIGSNFIRMMLSDSGHEVVNLDTLTYAGNLENLTDIERHPRYQFVRGDIADPVAMEEVFATHKPDVVVHFAAESHVDRSVLDASLFVRTNVTGTQVLLDKSRAHKVVRFVHVSTDEVYGSLGAWGYFTEDTPMQANSPYSASKAGSDLLVRAAVHTHHMDCVITRCSNNYGPYQFPEKLIPLMIANALEGKQLPVYGDGKNVRDWIYVTDHCAGIRAAMERGKAGEVYNFGGNAERENLFVVKEILRLLGKGEEQIHYVKDRPGHDRRYAMDSSKARALLLWEPKHTFEQGLRATVDWYLLQRPWWERVRTGAYQDYYKQQYANRC